MEDKIKAIYEKIANKELNFGCKVKNKQLWTIWFLTEIKEDYINILTNNWIYSLLNYNIEIIGHPVMFWDVIYFLEKNWYDLFWTEILEELLIVWKDKRKSIDELSEHVISYIYNLIIDA